MVNNFMVSNSLCASLPQPYSYSCYLMLRHRIGYYLTRKAQTNIVYLSYFTYQILDVTGISDTYSFIKNTILPYIHMLTYTYPLFTTTSLIYVITIYKRHYFCVILTIYIGKLTAILGLTLKKTKKYT